MKRYRVRRRNQDQLRASTSDADITLSKASILMLKATRSGAVMHEPEDISFD